MPPFRAMTAQQIAERKRTAAGRAEKIRLGLQSTAVLYTLAVTEEDWRVLGYGSIAAWREAEFGPVRFKADYRQEIGALLTAKGWTQREIAAATGASQDTVKRDQAEPGERDRSPQAPPAADPAGNARQRAARQREETRRGAAVTPPTRKTQPGPTEEQIIACVRLIGQGKSQTEAGRQLGLKDNSMALAAAYAAARERLGGHGKAAPVTNLNGKTTRQRERELKEARRAGAHTALIEFQVKIAQMCTILEDFNVQEYGTEDVDVWLMTDLLDDLISLGEWHGRQLSAVLGYLNEVDVRSRIAKLRNTAGRTPAEAEVALGLADKLERKLNARLEAS